MFMAILLYINKKRKKNTTKAHSFKRHELLYLLLESIFYENIMIAFGIQRRVSETKKTLKTYDSRFGDC